MDVEPAAALQQPAAGLMQDALVDIAAGTAAGVGICLAGHPFDTVKARGGGGGACNGRAQCGRPQVLLQTQSSARPQYASMVDAFAQACAPEVGRYACPHAPALDICLSACAHIGHLLVRMRPYWTFAYPHAPALDLCLSACARIVRMIGPHAPALDIVWSSVCARPPNPACSRVRATAWGPRARRRSPRRA